MNKKVAILLILLVFSISSIAISILNGALTLTSDNIDLITAIRIPRTLGAFLAGSGLGLSGLIFQALFRNPLATPYTLGVSSGASFGAALFIKSQIAASFFFIPGITIASFSGALLSIGIVYLLSKANKKLTTTSILLAGAAVNLFFSSLILFIQYISDYTESISMMHWLMGSLDSLSSDKSIFMGFFALLLFFTTAYFHRELNLFAVSEEIALARGTDTAKVRKILFFIVSLAVGGIVSFTGPIGFVGLMAPHIMRLIIGSDHKYLAPAVFLFGGFFLTLCDTFARIAISPAEMPVGIITSLLGGPFFIWLLVRK